MQESRAVDLRSLIVLMAPWQRSFIFQPPSSDWMSPGSVIQVSRWASQLLDTFSNCVEAGVFGKRLETGCAGWQLYSERTFWNGNADVVLLEDGESWDDVAVRTWVNSLREPGSNPHSAMNLIGKPWASHSHPHLPHNAVVWKIMYFFLSSLGSKSWGKNILIINSSTIMWGLWLLTASIVLEQSHSSSGTVGFIGALLLCRYPDIRAQTDG